ncbi:MAG: hypothetical protein LUI87_05815, partial [Lachnospiraceae bacterium]|nr:hypothetical protein [Lachnospiraceae bacterium]
IILKEQLKVSNINNMDIIGHMLIYLLLLLLLIYVVIYNLKKEDGNFIIVLGWIESVAIYILPLSFVWKGGHFLYIKGYPIDYLHIYGVLVLLNTIQFIHFCIAYSKKEKLDDLKKGRLKDGN